MYIKCNNINDFCTMITTCALNSIDDIRVFIEDSKHLTYILFTPLYTAIYLDNVNEDKKEIIFKTLLECQENCNHSFRIQQFRYLDFKDNCLTVEGELNVI